MTKQKFALEIHYHQEPIRRNFIWFRNIFSRPILFETLSRFIKTVILKPSLDLLKQL